MTNNTAINIRHDDSDKNGTDVYFVILKKVVVIVHLYIIRHSTVGLF